MATPQQLLDEAYDARLQALERIRASAAAVHASRARLEASRRTSVAELARLEQQARDALNTGDDVSARIAAAKCVPIDADISATDGELARYAAAEAHLAGMRDVVGEQLNALRKRRDSLRGASATTEALQAVHAELALLAAPFASVEREVGPPER